MLRRILIRTVYPNPMTRLKVFTIRFCSFFLVFLLPCVHTSIDGFNGGAEGEEIRRSDFPKGFFFGTATSSYQIEGAYLEDGKGLGNWDVFSHTNGKIENGENGDVCDDHYHRYLEDIETMHSLGVNAYRFSISWARLLPKGRFGEVNPKAIIFYNKIIDNLLLRGIVPFVTIHHHDLPQELEDIYGAWLSPLMQEDFVHFAETCFKNFGNRVKYWITINELNLWAEFAYKNGYYPPARCSEPFGNCPSGNSTVEPLIAMHNMLLAHAKAIKLYRERYQHKQGASFGITVSSSMYEPYRDNIHDQDAANRAMAFFLGWCLDPVIFGDYPSEMRRYHGSELPKFTAEEKKYLRDSIDFIGVNHYTTLYARDCLYSSCVIEEGHPMHGFAYITGERDGVLIGEPTGMSLCYVVPRGIEEMVEYFRKRYHNKPMFLTENGYPSEQLQHVKVGELLNDVKRVEFHKAYLTFLARTIRNGADVRGYFVWTLMDDFEWIHGYGTRFGLYYVEPQTLNRIPKLSAKWYNNFLTNSSGLSSRQPNSTSSVQLY